MEGTWGIDSSVLARKPSITDDFACSCCPFRLFQLKNEPLQTILHVVAAQFICFSSKTVHYRRFCVYLLPVSSVLARKRTVTDDWSIHLS